MSKQLLGWWWWLQDFTSITKFNNFCTFFFIPPHEFFFEKIGLSKLHFFHILKNTVITARGKFPMKLWSKAQPKPPSEQKMLATKTLQN